MATSPLVDEFLQPKAMLTPGIAGGLTMLITNAVTSQFGLLPNYTGLGISFLFGLLVLYTSASIPRLQLLAYYVLNSLVIFSVAIGTNHAGVGGAKAIEAKQSDTKIADWSPGTPFFANWLDGTVQHRDSIQKSVDAVDAEHAKEALKELRVPVETREDPKQVLSSYVAGTRTAADVDKVARALYASASNETPTGSNE